VAVAPLQTSFPRRARMAAVMPTGLPAGALRQGRFPHVREPHAVGRCVRLVAAASVALILAGCSPAKGPAIGEDPVASVAPPGDAADKAGPGGTKERPIATSGSTVVIRYDTSVPPGIVDSVAETVGYARVDFGDSGPLVVNVYGTSRAFVSAHEPRAQEQARKDIEGGGFAFGGAGVVWIYAPTYAKGGSNSRRLTLLHEYFHTVQASLSGPRRARPPLWLIEGSAKYFELRTGADRGYAYFDRQREDQMVKSKPLGPLASYETEGASPARGGHGEAYTLGFVASDYLVERSGVDALKHDFWALLASTPDWKLAFANAFGISVADFYVAFEAERPKS
jgi:hypothetical protein